MKTKIIFIIMIMIFNITTAAAISYWLVNKEFISRHDYELETNGLSVKINSLYIELDECQGRKNE